MSSFDGNLSVDDTWLNFDIDQIENSNISFRDSLTEPEEVSLDWSHLTSQSWSRRSETEIAQDQDQSLAQFDFDEFCQDEDRMFEDGNEDFEDSDPGEYYDEESGSSGLSQNQSHNEHHTRLRSEHVISEVDDQSLASLLWGPSSDEVVFDLNVSVSSNRNRNTNSHEENFMLVPDCSNQVRS